MTNDKREMTNGKRKVSVRSNLEQVRNDSRSPALWLLILLLLSVAFFALGMAVGRWTSKPCPPQSPAPPPNQVTKNQ